MILVETIELTKNGVTVEFQLLYIWDWMDVVGGEYEIRSCYQNIYYF